VLTAPSSLVATVANDTSRHKFVRRVSAGSHDDSSSDAHACTAACHASARVTTGALWRCLRRDDRVRQPTAAVAAALDQRHVDAHRRHEGLQVRVRLVAARLAPDRQRDIAIACVLGVGRSSGTITPHLVTPPWHDATFPMDQEPRQERAPRVVHSSDVLSLMPDRVARAVEVPARIGPCELSELGA
jgi:hypothetical protein